MVRLRLSNILIPAALGLASVPALTRPSGGLFEITKSTIDGGGGSSKGAAFDLNGTIGQPDASDRPLTGGAFELSGGFWPGGESVPDDDLIFADGFEES